jgi:hypothetical protein
MGAILYLIPLVFATILAAAAAMFMNWLLLQAAFRFMRPATAGRIPQRVVLPRSTPQLARAMSSHR